MKTAINLYGKLRVYNNDSFTVTIGYNTVLQALPGKWLELDGSDWS